MKVVTVIHNAVRARLVEPEEEVRCLVQEYLSYEVQGAEHMGKGGWDGRTSLFQRQKNQFPAGFVGLVRSRLTQAGYKVSVKRKEPPAPRGEQHPQVDDFGFTERYAYQYLVPERLVDLKMMIAQIATGGGKSRVFKMCAKRLNMPTLFLTNRKSLMYQMAEGYQESFPDEAIGIVGDGKWNPNANGVTFAIVDTLVSRLEVYDFEKMARKEIENHLEMVEDKIVGVLKMKKLPFTKEFVKIAPESVQKAVSQIREAVANKLPFDQKAVENKIKAKIERQVARRKSAIAFLEKILFVTLEEAHDVSGSGFFNILNSCKNADYRLALTATPFMKGSEEANMRLMAAAGSIGIKVSEESLIEKGILAKPYFKYIPVPRAVKLFRSTPWQKAYKAGIVDNGHRNAQVIEHCIQMKRRGLTTMVLVQQTKHGDVLKKMMKQAELKAEFIRGADEQVKRQEALNKLGSGQIDVLIGTTILDVGVDVPAVGMVILAGGGKAEVALRQRIGRGLREKKKGANVCFIVDFADGHNNHLQDHYQERRAIVEGTPGFNEGVVDDFDYKAILGA